MFAVLLDELRGDTLMMSLLRYMGRESKNSKILRMSQKYHSIAFDVYGSYRASPENRRRFIALSRMTNFLGRSVITVRGQLI